MNFIPSFTILLLFQLLGTFVQYFFSLPVPGSVMGMILLLIVLLKYKKLSANLQNTSLTILYYLPLLFVPAGVGIMQEFPLIKRQWLPISGAIIGSCIITLIFTALVMQFFLNVDNQKGGK